MRNIILVTSPIADGKSALIHRIQDELVLRKIPQALGGKYHMHDGQIASRVHEHDGVWYWVTT